MLLPKAMIHGCIITFISSVNRALLYVWMPLLPAAEKARNFCVPAGMPIKAGAASANWRCHKKNHLEMLEKSGCFKQFLVWQKGPVAAAGVWMKKRNRLIMNKEKGKVG